MLLSVGNNKAQKDPLVVRSDRVAYKRDNCNKQNLHNLREVSDLPIAIGFGIQTPNQAGEFAKLGFDGVVVGSTIVKEISENYLAKKSAAEIVNLVSKKVSEFGEKIKTN